MNEDHKKELGLDQFPSNSIHSPVEKEVAPKETKKIVQGKVRQKKRSILKRVGDEYIEEDKQSVMSYIFRDILIPSSKDLMLDMVNSALEMFFWGSAAPATRRGVRRPGIPSSGRVNYGGVSTGLVRGQPQDRTISKAGRSRHDFNELIFENRGEAEEILAHLIDMTIDFGQATVADFYGAAGVSSNFTDNRYGWTDLSGVTPMRVRGGGYVLNLPRTQPLA